MLSANEHDINTIVNFAIISERQGRLEEAITHFRRAIDLRPEISTLHFNLGVVLQRVGRIVEAERSYREAIRRSPAAKAHYNLAMLLASENRADEAVTEYNSSLALDPNSWETLNNLGSLLIQLGNIEEGAGLFERALQITPWNAGIHHNLARAKKFEQGDPGIEAMEKLCQRANLSSPERMYLHFALGKAYADVCQYSAASRHFIVGNSVKRPLVFYDETSTLSAFGRIIPIFTRDLFNKLSQQSSTTRFPIFILGMPRSGTTLVEQILASHPLVIGSGESLQIERAFATVFPGQSLSNVFPDIVQQLNGNDLVKLGGSCVETMQMLAPQARHVIDKSISNFALAGLIHLSLPCARMIHIRRDPIDTCLSCFSTLFAENAQPFTYNLGEVARYHNCYWTIMQHWRRVLPPDVFFEIDYQDIVTNFEANVQRLLEFCGLPWNDACLEFNKTNRLVKTASAAQVRKQIYRTSLGRWHEFTDLVEPLQQALRPEADQQSKSFARD